MRPAQVLCKYAGQVGFVSSDGAYATAASANSQSAADSSHDTIVCLSNAVNIPLPPGTVKCLSAVLRQDKAKAFGSELHKSGYLAGFKMTSA